MTVEVRDLQLSEIIEQLPPLCDAFYDETIRQQFTKAPGFNWGLFVKQYESANRAGLMSMLGLLDNERVVGFLCYAIVPDMCIGALIASEAFWYVDPAYRTCGLQLQARFMEVAVERDADAISIGHFPKGKNGRIGKLLRKQGFHHYQEQYIKPLIEV